MNKERKVIEENAVVIFNRDVKAKELNKFFKDFRGGIIINQKLIVDEALELKCDLYVEGDIECTPCYRIKIEGDLYCYGMDMDCFNVFVNGSFYSDARIEATDIKVGEDFCCKAAVQAGGSSIIVGGDFECYSIETQEIHVCGQMKVDTGISATIIKVGY